MPSLASAMFVNSGDVVSEMNTTPKLHSNGTQFRERQLIMNSTSRKILLVCALASVFALGMVAGQNKFGQPKSILHVITVQWKSDSTAEQRQAAIDGVKTMASQIPGVSNVWLKTVKVQGKDAVIVMEFKDQAAFDAYVAHPAHKKWEEVYLPIREQSQTHDITN
jgi:hypothetical protein